VGVPVFVFILGFTVYSWSALSSVALSALKSSASNYFPKLSSIVVCYEYAPVPRPTDIVFVQALLQDDMVKPEAQLYA
jgi:hypothetical protein